MNGDQFNLGYYLYNALIQQFNWSLGWGGLGGRRIKSVSFGFIVRSFRPTTVSFLLGGGGRVGGKERWPDRLEAHIEKTPDAAVIKIGLYRRPLILTPLKISRTDQTLMKLFYMPRRTQADGSNSAPLNQLARFLSHCICISGQKVSKHAGKVTD